VIPVALAAEPASFNRHVRARGAVAIRRRLGKKVNAAGRKPALTYARLADIPSDKFPAYWTEVRKSDGKSALDDMMDAYGQFCAYLALRLEWATGSPTVDHYVPKERDRGLVYEWSNYRLCTGCVNGAKGTKDVVDPFRVKPGWFELDLDTFLVRRGDAAPVAERARIDETLTILNLRQCVRQRGDYISRYRAKKIDLAYVTDCAPFIASELRRQGKLVRGKGTP
jgi:hypothetical protein